MSANKMTQTTSIETIGGKLFTVIWHELDAKKALESGADMSWYDMHVGAMLLSNDPDRFAAKYVATALPALPRNPTQGDARLLHAYAAQGVYIRGINADGQEIRFIPEEDGIMLDNESGGIGDWYSSLAFTDEGNITHGLMNGERCEVAIIEKEK